MKFRDAIGNEFTIGDFFDGFAVGVRTKYNGGFQLQVSKFYKRFSDAEKRLRKIAELLNLEEVKP